MPDYTEANAIKKITTGDEAGTWGASTNNNFDIIDRASNGYSNALNIQGLSGSGTATAPYELPQSTTAVLSDGHYKVIRFTSAGSLSSSTYLRLARNDKARMYMFVNATTGSQSIIVSQSDAGDISSATNVTIENGKSAIVLADGAGGSSSTVIDFSALIGGIAELDVTAGTVTASKAVVVDSNKDITGFRNVTLTGELDAATLDISGDADIDGTLEADAITVNGTALSSVIAGTTVTNATNATNATQLANARTIGGVSFNGTANIDLPGVNTAGNQDTSGNAATATTATTAGTVTTAAQPNITSLGTLTELTVDNVVINGSTMSNVSVIRRPNVDNDISIETGGVLYLKVDTVAQGGGIVYFYDSGSQRCHFNLDTADTLKIFIGSTPTEEMRITKSGVTIANGLYVGSVSGSLADNEIRAEGDITANYSSDISLKENIVVIENAVSKINAIRGVNFDWTDEHIASRGGEDGYFVRKKDVGVIAQEVEKVLPEVVSERKDGTKTVDYQKMVSLLVEGIKELSSEIEKLKGST